MYAMAARMFSNNMNNYYYNSDSFTFASTPILNGIFAIILLCHPKSLDDIITNLNAGVIP